MGDTSSSAGAESARTIDDKREPLPRLIYLALRLKELSSDLHAIVTERQELNATLKDHSKESSKEVRKMRERRGYLAIRINVLRAEQHGLAAEKEALSPLETALVGAKKKAKAG